MAEDAQTRGPRWHRPLRLALVVGLFFAGAALLIYDAEQRPGWAGLALMVVALIALLMGDEALSEISVGPGGLSAKLAKVDSKVSKARDEVADLKQVTEELKTLVGTVGRLVVQETGAPSPGEVEEAHPAAAQSEREATASRDRDDDDPHKGQWGGEAEAAGRRLSAKVEPIDGSNEWFDVSLRVESTDRERPLTGRVRFHLHPTFARSVVTVKAREGVAQLERVAWGAFTAGVEVLDDHPPTRLELDLAQLPSAPAAFRRR